MNSQRCALTNRLKALCVGCVTCANEAAQLEAEMKKMCEELISRRDAPPPKRLTPPKRKIIDDWPASRHTPIPAREAPPRRRLQRSVPCDQQALPPLPVADCGWYQVDVAAAAFGSCKCGLPKSQHSEMALTSSYRSAKIPPVQDVAEPPAKRRKQTVGEQFWKGIHEDAFILDNWQTLRQKWFSM